MVRLLVGGAVDVVEVEIFVIVLLVVVVVDVANQWHDLNAFQS
jgi:hypothetical protein